MKLNKRDMPGCLATLPKNYRAVLFYGPDEGQVALYRKQLLSILFPTPEDSMAIVPLASEKISSEPPLLYEALSSMSLLGAAPVVVVNPATDKVASAVGESLSMLECQNFLILCAGELSPRSPLRALFDKDKKLASFACYRDEGRDLVRFLEQALQAKGIRAERDAISYLSSQLGNDRSVSMQEIEKISLFLGEETYLSLRDAQALVGGNDNFSLDELCLALGNMNYAAVFSLTQKLLAEGINGVTILRAASRHFERLKEAKYKMQEGKGAEETMDALRPPVFFKAKPDFKKQLSMLSSHHILRACALLLEGEISIKRGKDAESACLQTLTQVCRASAA